MFIFFFYLQAGHLLLHTGLPAQGKEESILPEDAVNEGGKGEVEDILKLAAARAKLESTSEVSPF